MFPLPVLAGKQFAGGLVVAADAAGVLLGLGVAQALQHEAARQQLPIIFTNKIIFRNTDPTTKNRLSYKYIGYYNLCP